MERGRKKRRPTIYLVNVVSLTGESREKPSRVLLPFILLHDPLRSFHGD